MGEGVREKLNGLKLREWTTSIPGFNDLAGNVCVWMLAKCFRMIHIRKHADIFLEDKRRDFIVII